jgi:AcrR family transcriptional regulator
VSEKRWVEIQQAAARVFKEKGYDRATVQDIAKAVGILPGSLYYYFRSKEELLLKLVETPMNELVTGAEQIAESNDLPINKLRATIKHHIASYHRHFPHLFLVTEEPIEALPVDKRETMICLKKRYKRAWESIFIEGQASGEFKSDLDAGTIVYAILGACNWMVHWYNPEGRFTHDQISDHYISFILDGVVAHYGSV